MCNHININWSVRKMLLKCTRLGDTELLVLQCWLGSLHVCDDMIKQCNVDKMKDHTKPTGLKTGCPGLCST